MRLFLSSSLLFCSMWIHAQSAADISLIRAADFDNQRYHSRQVKFGFFDAGTNWLVRYNPVSLFLSSSMYMYQKAISPQISGSCLYSPSCSGYSKTAIKDFGIVKGSVVTADRLMRCNRLAIIDVPSWKTDAHSHKIHEGTEIYNKLYYLKTQKE